MAISDFIKRLFGLAPRYETTATSSLYKSIVTALKRSGIQVGHGAGYPRVEVHSFTEGARLDKEGMLRELSFIVESMSNRSEIEAATMTEENMYLLTSDALVLPEGWRLVGIIPEQLQDILETSDPQKILYRQLQSYRAWVERIKTADAENNN